MQGLLVDVLGLDAGTARIVQLVVAFVIVVAALALVIWGLVRLTRRFRREEDYAPARLRITEIVPLDDRRRLVLVRRDDVEHLLMIGGPTDIVVEAAFRRTAAPRRAGARPEGETASAVPADEPPPPRPATAVEPHPAERAVADRVATADRASAERPGADRPSVARPPSERLAGDRAEPVVVPPRRAEEGAPPAGGREGLLRPPERL